MTGSASVDGGDGSGSGPQPDSEPRPAGVGGGSGPGGPAVTAGWSESPGRRLGVIAFLTLVATLATYFSLPIYDDARADYLWLRLAVFVVGLCGLVYLLVRQISVGRTAAVYIQRVQWLFTAICLVILVFAVTYLVMARSGDREFVELWTKTDALYFTVTVLTTVGFGDIHATGQAARLVVTVQMGFDVLFIATAGSALRAAGVGRRRLHLDEFDRR